MRIILREAGVEYVTTAMPCIRTPEDIVKVVPELRGLNKEVMAVLMLDSCNQLIEADIVTMGLLDASLAHPREIFRQAIVKDAAAIIVVHNHPSGVSNPSPEDIRVTRQLVDAGKIIDIPVLDHLIVGADSSTSMKAAGLVNFNIY